MGLFDALISFLRLIRFLRNGLGVKTSDWWGRWLHQVKDAHGQSKSSSKLPSLCSTQPHINGLFAQVLTTMGRETLVCRRILQVITVGSEPGARTASPRSCARSVISATRLHFSAPQPCGVPL